MNLPIVALCLVVLAGVVLAVRAGPGPAGAFVAVAATMVAIQGSMLGGARDDFPLPLTASLAFLATPFLPGLLAAILYPPDANR